MKNGSGSDLPSEIVEKLSARERDVAILVARGASRNLIAETLKVSIHTLDKHLARLRGKLGVKTNAEAAVVLRTAEAIPARQARLPKSAHLLRQFVPVSVDAVDDLAGSPSKKVLEDGVELLRPMSFDARWAKFHRHIHAYDGTHAMFALLERAEDPTGDVAVEAFWSLPAPFGESIVGAGRPHANPVLARVRQSHAPFATDIEAEVLPLAEHLPQEAVHHAQRLVDAGLGRGLTVPVIGLPTSYYGAVSIIFKDMTRPKFVELMGNNQATLTLLAHYFATASVPSALAEVRAGLSSEERELLQLVSQGASLREAAVKLRCSHRSAERLAARARNALGAKSLTEAVSLALRSGHIER